MNRHIRIGISVEDYKALCKVIDLLEFGEGVMFPLDCYGHFLSEYERQRPAVIAALGLPPIEETAWPRIFAQSPDNVNPIVFAKSCKNLASTPDIKQSAAQTRSELLELDDSAAPNRARGTQSVKDTRLLSILNPKDADTLSKLGIHVKVYYRSRFTKKEGFWWLHIDNPKGAYCTFSERYLAPNYHYPIARNREEIKREIWEAHLRAEADLPVAERRRMKREAQAKLKVDEWQAEWNSSGGA